MADLDLEAVEAFLARRVPGLVASTSFEDAATRVGLIAKSNMRPVPTAVGLLFFGKVPQIVQPDWALGAVAIHGSSLADAVRARVDAEGTLESLLAQGLAFVREQTGADAAYPAAAEEYPEAAVREALVNALVHRDLRRPGRVALRVFSDRLEIWSPGGPPEGVGDLDELLREGGVSQPRNPLLAATARFLGVVEQIGRGIPVLGRLGGAAARRVEIRSTPRDVTVVIPSKWQASRGHDVLSS